MKSLLGKNHNKVMDSVFEMRGRRINVTNYEKDRLT